MKNEPKDTFQPLCKSPEFKHGCSGRTWNINLFCISNTHL